jgi:hypothetical protein
MLWYLYFIFSKNERRQQISEYHAYTLDPAASFAVRITFDIDNTKLSFTFWENIQAVRGAPL